MTSVGGRGARRGPIRQAGAPITASVWPASRSASVSPMQTMAIRPARERRLGLGAHQRVGLAMVGAAFGMADDDMGRAGIRQHRGRNVAGMGARRPWRGNPARRPSAALPCAAQAIWAISVAGGQSSISQAGAGMRGDQRPSTSARAAAVPFIFQFPAASLLHALSPPDRATRPSALERKGKACRWRRALQWTLARFRRRAGP